MTGNTKKKGKTKKNKRGTIFNTREEMGERKGADGTTLGVANQTVK